MARYVLECETCGEQLDFFAPMSAEKPKTCTCGGTLFQKFSPPALFWGKAPFCFRKKFAAPHYDSKKP